MEEKEKLHLGTQQRSPQDSALLKSLAEAPRGMGLGVLRPSSAVSKAFSPPILEGGMILFLESLCLGVSKGKHLGVPAVSHPPTTA